MSRWVERRGIEIIQPTIDIEHRDLLVVCSFEVKGGIGVAQPGLINHHVTAAGEAEIKAPRVVVVRVTRDCRHCAVSCA